jgi:predicted amidohydrolase
MDDDARARLAVAGREANDGEMETRWRCSRPGVLAVDACPELWMPGTERATMALGLVIVSARADLLIVIPRACTSLVAGDAASPLARAIVDIGAACVDG